MTGRQLIAFLCTSCLLYLCMTSKATLIGDDPELKLSDAKPCVPYSGSVKEFGAKTWVVYYNFSKCKGYGNSSQPTMLRAHTKSTNASISSPVVFVTRIASHVQSWQLPLKSDAIDGYINSAKHTICSYPLMNILSDDRAFVMDVFTSSSNAVGYSFEFQPVEDFKLKLNQVVKFNVSGNEPQLYYFKIPKGKTSVRVVASSQSDDNCAVVSIQNASCPVNDQLENARSKGEFQTMIKSASLVVRANKTIRNDEFFVVIVSADSDVCVNKQREKSSKEHFTDSTDSEIELKVVLLQPAKSYRVAIALPFIVFMTVGTFTLFVFWFSDRFGFSCSYVPSDFKGLFDIKLLCHSPCCGRNRDYGHFFKDEGSSLSLDEQSEFAHEYRQPSSSVYGSLERTGIGAGQIQAETTGPDPRDSMLPMDQSPDPSRPDPRNSMLPMDQSPESSLERTGSFRKLLIEIKENELTIPNFLRSGYANLEKSYKVYGWNTITVGIFYALPAFQLVFSQQLVLDQSGDQDICYYNFKCARPYGTLSAFNNVWSNVGYFIMGLAFLGIVSVRHYRANQLFKFNKPKFYNYGVPQFFGIYYAMGFGMIMEAFMSAFYHICPSDNNFQFDTAFMFIIGGLLIVKMLQVRHPDIQANAFVAFFCFAVVIFLTFVGIWEWSKSYWQTKFLLVLLALIGIAVFAVSYYFFHDWRVGSLIEKQAYVRVFSWFKSWCVLCNTKEKTREYLPKHPYRFVKMSLLVFANFAAGILLVCIGKGIATVVLALFILNFILLMILYLLCKLYYRERFTVMPVAFMILIGVCWAASFRFYFDNVSQWEDSPAGSRNFNEECIVLDFYDNHDVWHFLSAGAMFFSFLFLFTLDDGMQDIKRREIHVF